MKPSIQNLAKKGFFRALAAMQSGYLELVCPKRPIRLGIPLRH